MHGDQLDLAPTATISIFVGLAFSWVAGRIGQRFFLRLARTNAFDLSGSRKDFWSTWVDLVSASLERRGLAPRAAEVRCFSREQVSRFAYAHYARLYKSSELYGFRLPKTFGVLYFNLGAASIVVITLLLVAPYIQLFSKYRPASGYYLLDLASLLVLAGLFLTISRDYFLNSLNFELHYWIAAPEERI